MIRGVHYIASYKICRLEVAMPVIHASNASCLVVHQYTHGLQGFSCLGVRKTTKLPMHWFEKASKTWPHGIFSLGFGVCKYVLENGNEGRRWISTGPNVPL